RTDAHDRELRQVNMRIDKTRHDDARAEINVLGERQRGSRISLRQRLDTLACNNEIAGVMPVHAIPGDWIHHGSFEDPSKIASGTHNGPGLFVETTRPGSCR